MEASSSFTLPGIGSTSTSVQSVTLSLTHPDIPIQNCGSQTVSPSTSKQPKIHSPIAPYIPIQNCGSELDSPSTSVQSSARSHSTTPPSIPLLKSVTQKSSTSTSIRSKILSPITPHIPLQKCGTQSTQPSIRHSLTSSSNDNIVSRKLRRSFILETTNVNTGSPKHQRNRRNTSEPIKDNDNAIVRKSRLSFDSVDSYNRSSKKEHSKKNSSILLPGISSENSSGKSSISGLKRTTLDSRRIALLEAQGLQLVLQVNVYICICICKYIFICKYIYIHMYM
jgi:hypothetical protein